MKKQNSSGMTEAEECGFLYVVTGRKFYEEALESRKTLLESNPSARVSIATDCIDCDETIWDEVIRLVDVKNSYIDKILPLLESPYERTIFLDSDTHILEPLDDLFKLLDRFDFAAAMETKPKLLMYATEVPISFVEHNTGVMVYRLTSQVRDFIQNWHSTYQKSIGVDAYTTHDQPAFREALYLSKVNFYTLPSHYNFRTVYLAHSTRNLKVAIVHDRWFPKKILKEFKDSRYERVVFPGFRQIRKNSILFLGAGGAFMRSMVVIIAQILKCLESVFGKIKK